MADKKISQNCQKAARVSKTPASFDEEVQGGMLKAPAVVASLTANDATTEQSTQAAQPQLPVDTSSPPEPLPKNDPSRRTITSTTGDLFIEPRDQSTAAQQNETELITPAITAARAEHEGDSPPKQSEQLQETRSSPRVEHEGNSSSQQSKMRQKTRGLCLIINNMFFPSTRLCPPPIAKPDVDMLTETFEKLGYEIKTGQYLTKDKIKRQLDKTAKAYDGKDYDSFVCCILASGDRDGFKEYAGGKMTVADITKRLSPPLCSSLSGKLKFVFVLAFSPTQSEKTELGDGMHESDDDDFFIRYYLASGNNFYQNNHGSLLVRTLSEIFLRDYKSRSLSDMLTDVDKAVNPVENSKDDDKAVNSVGNSKDESYKLLERPQNSRRCSFKFGQQRLTKRKLCIIL